VKKKRIAWIRGEGVKKKGKGDMEHRKKQM
jgi:hypothetical protein